MNEGIRNRRKERSQNDSAGEKYSSFNIFNWGKFLAERAPPLVFLLLASGPCLTGLYIVEGKLNWWKCPWAIFGELVLLLIVRVMDDVKDYELDCAIHPDRPLPRGLIKYSEVVTVINLVLGAMSMYAGIMAWTFSLSVGLTFGVQVLVNTKTELKHPRSLEWKKYFLRMPHND